MLKKTYSNYFACLVKQKKIIFSITYYSFIQKNKKDAYRLFFFRLFKFFQTKIYKYKIKHFNLIMYGRYLYKYSVLIKKKLFKKGINHFYFYSGVAYNGCKLKKKKRK